jgi:hypothetical protein
VQLTIEQVLARHAPELMRIEGVEGVGQALCDGQPCVRVYLRDAAAASRVPRELDGYRVDTVVTGGIGPRTSD